MAEIFEIHPKTPQARNIDRVVQRLRQGAVMLYPTDTVYAIGCNITVKDAVARVRQIKRLANEKPLTFLCSSLSNIAAYARVSDSAYRIIRRLIPGPYTFLLPATKEVPKLVMAPKRKTSGIRVPDRAICQALLQGLGDPIVSTSAHVLSDDEDSSDFQEYAPDRATLFDKLESLVDIIVDDGREPGYQTSTILDMTGENPAIARKGLGWERAAELVD